MKFALEMVGYCALSHFFFINYSFTLLMVVSPDFKRPLLPPTIALAFASAFCFLAGWLAYTRD